MKLFLAFLPFIVYNASAQHPYKDSLKEVYKIDEGLIISRKDTTVSFFKNRNVKDILINERIIICRDSKNSIIRIDRIFPDTTKFAFAYFINHEFHLMQWNEPKERSLYESASAVTFIRNPDIRTFYIALLTLPNVTMPKLTTYTH